MKLINYIIVMKMNIKNIDVQEDSPVKPGSTMTRPKLEKKPRNEVFKVGKYKCF